MAYKNFQVKISDNQKDKIQRAIKNKEGVTIRIDPNKNGNDVLALTNTQINKLEKGKPVDIKFSKAQLKHNMEIEGGFLSMLAGLAARALPMLAKTVLPALGVGALSGLASSGVQKVFGNGLYLKKGGNLCKIESDGKGLYLGTVTGSGLNNYGDGLYLEQGGQLYNGEGILGNIVKDIPLLNILF